MEKELVNNVANETIYQLQYYENLYRAHEKINKIFLILFFHNNHLFDCNSRLLLFKTLINLLIELFL